MDDGLLTNCIIWGNTGSAPGIYSVNSTPTIIYSIVQGVNTGAGNLSTDPLFVNPADPDGMDNVFGTADDGLRLLLGSPAINAARNDSIPNGIVTDITGAPRIQNSIVDMGAYETNACYATHKLYVDSSLSIAGDGSSWGMAFRNLRQALEIAATCPGIDSILVAKGTYLPAGVNSGNRDTSFALLRGGLKLYGGYPSGGGVCNITANPTILSGDIGIAGDNTDNSYHVVVVAGLGATADSLVMDGFTISGGNANGYSGKNYNGFSVYNREGGGMILIGNNTGKKCTIRNCTFANNSSYSGGGMSNEISSPTITNCTFANNSSGNGGGIFNEYSDPSIVNCTFANNSSSNYGGGMCNSSSDPAIVSCIFANNSSNSGGGMYNVASDPAIVNCTFANNSSSNYGGGMFNSSSDPAITSCTLAGNASNYGGGMYNKNSSPAITNCISWGNTGLNFGTGIFNESGMPVITYSLVQSGGFPGTGDLSTDPLFVNPADPDGPDNIFGTADDGLRLLAGSPALNTGINDSIPAGITTDITGALRIQSVRVDMGAYEGMVCPSYHKVYVDSSSSAVSSNGSSWNTAFRQLPQTLTIAAACPLIDSILIAKGTYKPTTDASRDSAFTLLRGGLKLYGAYPAGGAGVRNITANPTILSGDIGIANNSTDNSYHVVVVAGLPASADSLVLDGLTVVKGNASGSGSKTYNGVSIENNKGGAIVIKNNGSAATDTKIVVRNCTLSAVGSASGAAVHLAGVKVAANGCVIKNE